VIAMIEQMFEILDTEEHVLDRESMLTETRWDVAQLKKAQDKWLGEWHAEGGPTLAEFEAMKIEAKKEALQA
jgi:hypothetical protein